jgi:hypothetical protein
MDVPDSHTPCRADRDRTSIEPREVLLGAVIGYRTAPAVCGSTRRVAATAKLGVAAVGDDMKAVAQWHRGPTCYRQSVDNMAT